MMWNVVKSVFFSVGKLNITMLMVYLRAQICFSPSVHSVLQASALNCHLFFSCVFIQRGFGLREQSLGRTDSHYHLVSSEDVFCNLNCENPKYFRSRYFFFRYISETLFVVGESQLFAVAAIRDDKIK